MNQHSQAQESVRGINLDLRPGGRGKREAVIMGRREGGVSCGWSCGTSTELKRRWELPESGHAPKGSWQASP